MKKVFKQILRATGFFGIYFGAQLTAYMILSVGCGIVAGVKIGMTGVTDYAAAVAYQEELYYGNIGIALILNVILALGVYLIIFAARKVNPLKQVDLKKITVPDALFTVAGGIGSLLFMNLIMNIIPFPETVFDDFLQTTQLFDGYPLWQAILSNVILIPILEEVVFRGLIFGRLRRAMPSIVAALIASVVFGLMHAHPLWIIWAFAVGMIINYARIRTGSILPGIIIHMMINGFGILANYSTLFNGMTDAVRFTLLATGGVLLVVYFVGITIVTKKEKAAGLIGEEPQLADEDKKKEKEVSAVVL